MLFSVQNHEEIWQGEWKIGQGEWKMGKVSGKELSNGNVSGKELSNEIAMT